MKAMLKSLTEEQYTQLARYLSYPRGVRIRDRESYNTMLQGRRVNQLMREVGKNNLDLLGMDLKDVKNRFAASLSGNSGRYMKTSSLIITYADLLTTGGHNLSSKISRVNSMTNYKRSRGSYTPTDYDKPADTEPVVSENKPTTSTPTSTAPVSSKPTSTARPAKKKPTNTTPSVKSKPANNGAANIRPRSSVISTSPRRTRGL